MSESNQPTAVPASPVKPFSFGPSNFVRGILGAIVGGAIGYGLFYFLYRNGFYAAIIPGAMLGSGAGYASGGKSFAMGAICLVMGTVLSVLGEWSVEPFAKDNSLGFFLKHLFEIGPVNLLMNAAGIVASFWFGVGRERLFTHRR